MLGWMFRRRRLAEQEAARALQAEQVKAACADRERAAMWRDLRKLQGYLAETDTWHAPRGSA